MLKNLRDGYIFPDDFYKKYTNFLSQDEFLKAAEKVDLLITIKSDEVKFKNITPRKEKFDIDIMIDDFIKENTKFNSWQEFKEKGENNYITYLEKPLLKKKQAIDNQVARDNYTLKCTNCKKIIEVAAEEIIPKCNCEPVFKYYKIL